MKIWDFLKSRYKVLIPIAVVFVLLITVYFFYREYQYDNYRNKKEVQVYQHFNGVRVDYTAQIIYNLKDVIVDVKSLDKKVEYDSTPIYYKESDSIIFPSEMSIVFPLNEGSQFKLYRYATYQFEENNNIIKHNIYSGKYNDFFLFDGEGLFFFPTSVTLKIDGKDYVTLGSMSYVKLIGGYTLEYYDKENDKAEFLEVEGKKISVYNERMEVDLTGKSLIDYGKKILLFSPSSLDSLNN